jgi:hypothetical protein
MLPRSLPAEFIAPCLPSKTAQLPSSRQWLHEMKHDGFRIIARRNCSQVRLYSRRANDFIHRFPLIVNRWKVPPNASADHIENRTAQSRSVTTMDRRLPAILYTEPCQGFDFPTFWASAPVLCPLLFCEERLGQLWSSRTRVSKKVICCSISVTGRSIARRSRDQASRALLNGRGASPSAARAPRAPRGGRAANCSWSRNAAWRACKS